jgi:hypothetical protein
MWIGAHNCRAFMPDFLIIADAFGPFDMLVAVGKELIGDAL